MKTLLRLLVLCCTFGAASVHAGASVPVLAHGRFEQVRIFAAVPPVRSFVILLSDADGWDRREQRRALQLAAHGALVAGLDSRAVLEMFSASGDRCLRPEGDIENLSRYVQAYLQVPGYFPPLLIGEGEGATLAYMLAAQSGAATYRAAISLGFCAQPLPGTPFCEVGALRRKPDGALQAPAQLPTPWLRLDAGLPAQATNCAAPRDAAFDAIRGARRLQATPRTRDALLQQEIARIAQRDAAPHAAVPRDLQALPLIEVPLAHADLHAETRELFAVLISGDGGWAGIDKAVGAELKARGVPVVGVDSLRYFWTPRTPAGIAQDLDRIVAYYRHHWQRPRVLLIGYSQGANVLPFVLHRLADDTRAALAGSVLMGLGARADFEFHLSNWVGSSDDSLPVAPEFARLGSLRPLCLYGEQEHDSLCPQLAATQVHALRLPGGHHFDGNYGRLAELIIANGS